MTKVPKMEEPSLTTIQFLESYNKNIPAHYPRVSLAQLNKFKKDHLSLFGLKGLWTLDKHRKRIIDWLQNI